MHAYPHPRPALTVDLVVVSAEPRPRVLLIRRGKEPFLGAWALPGGFVEPGEPLEGAARRELHEETGLAGLALGPVVQVGAYGDPGRDPRGWVVSVAYAARVDPRAVRPRAGDDAAGVGWHAADALPPLAFDHGRIVADALARVAPAWA